jgi:cyclohexa-1,5-dienecarbonyl-CoA hydratase
MDTEPITAAGTRTRSDVANGVARILLTNPPLNVIDVQMMEELAATLTELEASPNVSVVQIGGDGKAFSAGVDVAAHSPDRISTMLGGFHAVIRLLIASKKVTVAAVHGNCLGGGAEMAMICDIVYTAREARWSFPEIRLGCYPPVACAALAALVGQKRAAELILTGRTITGEEAAEIGLATGAVDESDLPEEISKCCSVLTSLSPVALSLTKKAIYAWDSMHFDKGLARAEKIYFEDLMQTADANEGVRAFIEKREPKWTGK